MSVTQQIFAMYRAPFRKVAQQFDMPPREGRIFTYLIVAALLFTAAGAPNQAREAFYDDTVPLNARLYWSGLWWLGVFPIFAYIIAAISHLVLRIFGSKGAAYRARLALFWALISLAPIVVLAGLTSAFIGPSTILTLLLFAIWGFGVFFWGVGLRFAMQNEATK